MKLTHLNDDQVVQGVKERNAHIRQETTLLLYYLAEMERRRLFAREGCDSLFSFCKQILNCSDGQAARRVNAARALVAVPEIKDKLKSGALTLTAVSQAQNFFRREPQALKTKIEIFAQLENTSTREADKILCARSSLPEAQVKEKVRVVSAQISEIKFAADEELLGDLDRLKEIWSHSMPGASFQELFKKMAKLCLAKFDPTAKAERAEKRRAKPGLPEKPKQERRRPIPVKTTPAREPRLSTPAPELNPTTKEHFPTKSKRHRTIPSAIKHEVWLRDGGGCTYAEATTGKRCPSRFKLEFDHIVPLAKGGDHSAANLRLRCFAHNQLHAIEQYGREKILNHSRPAS